MKIQISDQKIKETKDDNQKIDTDYDFSEHQLDENY